jgi:hypothetical protein
MSLKDQFSKEEPAMFLGSKTVSPEQIENLNNIFKNLKGVL